MTRSTGKNTSDKSDSEKLAKRGRSARKKGHDWEREVAIMFQGWGFPEARRHLEYQDAEANGVDLVGTSPFSVQTKCLAGSTNPLKVLDEIKDGGFRIAMIKRTGKGWYAALAPDTLAYLLESHEMLLRGFQQQPPLPSSEAPIRTLPEC